MFTHLLSKYPNFLDLFQNRQYVQLKSKIRTYPLTYALAYIMSKIHEQELDHDMTRQWYETCLEYDIPREYKTLIEHEYYNYPFTILQSWIEQRGGKISGVNVVYYDVDYRGMVARYPLLRDQTIMSIPYECCISRNMQQATEWGRTLTSYNHVDHDFLAIALLNVKYTPNHPQRHIVECIPKTFPSVPIFFTDDEKKELEGSHALELCNNKLNDLKRTYELIRKRISFPYTLEDYIWARTAIITRIYGINRNEQRDSVMVPFADMANHKIPPNTTWYFDTNKDAFIVKTTESIPVGDTIYETYGKKSNYRYFVNYGFIIPSNPDDNVCIRIEDREYYIGYTLDSQYTSMYEHALKVCRHNQKYTYTYLSNVCTSQLNGFPTTIREDIELLVQPNLPMNIRNCIVMRRCEKRLLRFLVAYFDCLASTDVDINNLRSICSKYNANSFAI